MIGSLKTRCKFTLKMKQAAEEEKKRDAQEGGASSAAAAAGGAANESILTSTIGKGGLYAGSNDENIDNDFS